MRRARFAVLLVAGCALAAAWALPAGAQETPPPTEPPPTEPPAVPVVPDGVSVGGIAVGGMAEETAFSVVRTAFDAPLVLTLGGRTLAPTPRQLGAVGYVRNAVRKALAAQPGTPVDVYVRVDGRKVRAYVALLAKRFDREARDSRVVLRKLRPFVTKERAGRVVDRPAAVAEIVRLLRRNERLPTAVPVKAVAPRVTRRNVGPVVVVRRASNRLFLYEGARYVRNFRVATGAAQYPTPLGRFQIVVKWKHPWWYPPDSDWARDEEPIPPGPGNPLGTRWMGISSPGVGIHGTPDPASLGYSVSHGCIRMAIPQAEWLFTRVNVGTPVFIVKA